MAGEDFGRERSRPALYRIPGGPARSTRRCRLTERRRRIRPRGRESGGVQKSRWTLSPKCALRRPARQEPPKRSAREVEGDGDQRRVGPLEETSSWKRGPGRWRHLPKRWDGPGEAVARGQEGWA